MNDEILEAIEELKEKKSTPKDSLKVGDRVKVNKEARTYNRDIPEGSKGEVTEIDNELVAVNLDELGREYFVDEDLKKIADSTLEEQFNTDYTLDDLVCPECGEQVMSYSQYNPGYFFCQACGTEFEEDFDSETDIPVGVLRGTPEHKDKRKIKKNLKDYPQVNVPWNKKIRKRFVEEMGIGGEVVDTIEGKKKAWVNEDLEKEAYDFAEDYRNVDLIKKVKKIVNREKKKGTPEKEIYNIIRKETVFKWSDDLLKKWLHEKKISKEASLTKEEKRVKDKIVAKIREKIMKESSRKTAGTKEMSDEELIKYYTDALEYPEVMNMEQLEKVMKDRGIDPNALKKNRLDEQSDIFASRKTAEMDREEIKWAGQDIASEYDSEAHFWYIKTNVLEDMAREKFPEASDNELRGIVYQAKSFLYQWGPETEEELEAWRANKESKKTSRKIADETKKTKSWPTMGPIDSPPKSKARELSYQSFTDYYSGEAKKNTMIPRIIKKAILEVLQQEKIRF